MWSKHDNPHVDRRKYVRLDSVFPVQFRLLSLDGKQFLSGWVQGFTNNIGKGGICLVVHNLEPAISALMINRKAHVLLEIDLPIARFPIAAKTTVNWVKDVFGNKQKYQFGLQYQEIDPDQNARVMRYVRLKQWFVPVVFSLVAALGIGVIVNMAVNARLVRSNKALVAQLVKIVQESTGAKQKIKEITREREDLALKIQALQTRISGVQQEKQNLESKIAVFQGAKIEELTKLIAELTAQKNALQENLISVQHQENTITEELLRLGQRRQVLTKANFDKMYQWVKIHQNSRTGLVMSFEGDTDIAKWAFVYDQSLASQAYTYFSDFERSRKMIDFFRRKAKSSDGLFYNAYFSDTGDPAEYTIHAGPNIWLGIAVVQYMHKSGDTGYRSFAEEIASSIMRLQDEEGGIRGGPGLPWYSTEHNLDAYAFFTMLYAVTGSDTYQVAARRVLAWLVAHTYDTPDIPVKRGKGDATIATDTYAWSIAAVGPEILEQQGLNPDRVMEFAETTCGVDVAYQRPDGRTVDVKGFDFAPLTHLARGGLVSSEWTAQMIISYKTMADFYFKKDMAAKARAYAAKADEYLANLTQMIISSPSPSGQGESCLPYATQDSVDTGHGWATPKGKSTGSVAGTAYTLFAYYKYNPLALNN